MLLLRKYPIKNVPWIFGNLVKPFAHKNILLPTSKIKGNKLAKIIKLLKKKETSENKDGIFLCPSSWTQKTMRRVHVI